MHTTTNADFRLVHLLAGTAGHFGKTYCYPSQTTIRARLSAWHGRQMSERTLNRHLAALEAQGWIKRQCRHRIEPGRGWCFRSTLYTLTRRTLRALAGLGGLVGRLAAKAAGAGRQDPSAISGRQSTSPGRVMGEGGAAPPPSTPQKVALEHLSAVKRLLGR